MLSFGELAYRHVELDEVAVIETSALTAANSLEAESLKTRVIRDTRSDSWKTTLLSLLNR